MKIRREEVQQNGAIVLVDNHKLDFQMRIQNQFKSIWGAIYMSM
jgi:hypothetical protein